MIGIYKVISPNGKIYIGQSVNIKRRWNQHKYQKLDTILSRSFKKYGVDNHTFEILCECEISELNEKERYYQDYYKAIGLNGLNSKLTQTDDKSGYTTEEVKFKIKISRIDKKEEKEYKFEQEYFVNDYEERIYEYEKEKNKYKIEKYLDELKRNERLIKLGGVKDHIYEDYYNLKKYIEETKKSVEVYYLCLEEEIDRQRKKKWEEKLEEEEKLFKDYWFKSLEKKEREQKENDIEFYYLKLDEERERYENSIDCII